MKAIARLASRFIAVLLVLAIVFVAFVYLASERHLRSFEPPPPFTHPIPTDATAIERGAHLVQTRGCSGCHGSDFSGRVMWEFAVAPNLVALAREESPATLEAAIRHGIGRDGKAMYSMPSYNFIRMRDEDLADVIAYLRSLPLVEKELPTGRIPFGIRLDIALGKDAAIAAYLDRVPQLKGAALGDVRLVRGEYIAMTTCNECHGFSLRADTPWEDNTPDLIIISAYTEESFRHLMKTGLALGERELELMSSVARSRFSNFSDQELSDLYAFLADMSARAMALHE